MPYIRVIAGIGCALSHEPPAVPTAPISTVEIYYS